MPKLSISNKLKRPANDSTKSKKLKLELSANKQMDDYIINLTQDLLQLFLSDAYFQKQIETS